MGARHAKSAFGLWAGKVPAGSLNALVFMALTAKDGDDPALFWGGHESIAVSVLGRTRSFTESDRRAVGRLIAPLFKAGAITLAKHSAPGRQACYALNLDLNTGRDSSCEQPVDTGRESSHEHGTECGSDTGRDSSGAHMNTGRVVVGTRDGNRPTEDYEDYLEQDIVQENSGQTSLEPQVVARGGW